ncbi:MAG: B12-binding domain-containing radical SAM protein [Deltaproteobacteria bacterium]
MPLLGPIYLGTILKQRGHRVRIYNENFCRPDYSRLEADLIGISILSSTSRRGYEIARLFPREKVIFGGVHASLLPREALPFCRQVVTGEAETVIADVVEGRRTEPIVEGVAVEDLDSLPIPDFSLVCGLPRSMRVQPVSTSRGCPSDCSFCSVTRVFGQKYRFRSAQSIVKELEKSIRGEIFFCDDNFCSDRKRLLVLMRSIPEMKKRFLWTCQARCEAGRDEELVKSMRRAGCRVVCLGLESVSDATLKIYNKRQSVEGIISAIKGFHRHGIKIHGMFVLGSEHDDAETANATLDFSLRHGIDTIQVSALTPFPGTRVYEDLTAKKAIFSRDWSLYDGLHVVFSPERISPLKLQQDIIKIHSAFYSLGSAFSLFLRFHIRDALFRLMGRGMVKEWYSVNRGLPWLSRSV